MLGWTYGSIVASGRSAVHFCELDVFQLAPYKQNSHRTDPRFGGRGQGSPWAFGGKFN